LGLIYLWRTGEAWSISSDGLALENNQEGRLGLNVGISGARAFGGALTGAGEGVVEPAGPVERPAAGLIAGPVAAGPVEWTALDLYRVRT
jgi:hypothetical protein